MNTLLTLSEEEAREILSMMETKLIFVASQKKPFSGWPLYDKMAEYLGMPTSKEHVDYLREKSEADRIDEWLSGEDK